MSKIENKDIFSQDLYVKEIEKANALLKATQELTNAYKSQLETTQKLVSSNKGNDSKSIREFNLEQEKLNVTLKELDKLKKAELSLEARLKLARSGANKDVLQQREELRKLNTEQKNANSLYKQQSARLNELRNRYKDLAVTEKQNTTEAKNLLKEITSLDNKLKKIDLTVGQGNRTVGLYRQQLDGLNVNLKKAEENARNVAIEFGRDSVQFKNATKTVNNYKTKLTELNKVTNISNVNNNNLSKTVNNIGLSLKGLLASLGIVAGISFFKNLALDLIEVGNQLRGVQFAFDKLGTQGVDALNRVRTSTRGLISDLDIKRSLVEFDNFNISLEETDTLFEFLAVRASQTGESIDNLKSSLVEGLSKESKLRIDNLGISASELNAELEKTPDFVQAVANIAKREIAEAGNILDDAGNAQQKWNVQLDNFKSRVATGLIPVFDRLFQVGTFFLKNIREIGIVVRSVVVGFTTYKTILALTNKESKLYIGFTKTMAFVQGILTKANKLSALSFKSIGTAIKGIPLVNIITGITTLISLLPIFQDEAEESAKQTKNFKDRLKELNDEIGNLSGIEERVSILDKLSKDQLKRLVDDIDTQIQLNSQRDTDIKVNESKAFKERESRLSDLYDELTRIQKNGDEDLISGNADRVLREINDLEQLNKKALSNLEARNIEENNQLNNYLKIVQQRIKAFKDEVKEVESGNSGVVDSEDDKEARLKEIREKANKQSSTIRKIESEQFSQAVKEQTELVENEKQKQLDIIEEGGVAEVDNLENLLNTSFNLRKTELENQRDFLLSNENLTAEDRELINLQFNGKFKDLEKERVDAVNDVNNEIIDNQKDFAEKQNELAIESEKARIQALIDSRKKTAKVLNEIGNAFVQAEEQRQNKLIQGIDKEINARQQRLGTLTSLAEQGSNDALSNIAREQREIAKLEQEREQRERRKQLNQYALGLLNTYTASLANGESPTKAIGTTLTSATALSGLISTLVNTLPSFYEGTEDTGKVSNALDSKGGRLSVLHDNERVVDKANNMHLQGISNDELGNLGKMYKAGLMQPKLDVVHKTNWQSNDKIISKLDELNQNIKRIDLPNFESSFDKHTNTMMSIFKYKDETKRINRKLR